MKIKIGFFGILMLFSLFVSHPSVSFPALLAATLHELGHITVAKLCGIQLRELKLGIFGAGLLINQHTVSYKKEILLCLAGPAANFFTAAFLWCFDCTQSNSFCSVLFLSSIALGGLNLLPIRDFDGGRILHALLCILFSPSVSERTVNVLSFCLVFLLWSFSLYLLLRTSNSLSFFIFSLALFSKLFLFSAPNQASQKSNKQENQGENKRKQEIFTKKT